MYLFFFDHIIQLDSLAPLIDFFIKEKKKVLIINTNPTSPYKKNRLLKFFKDQNVMVINHPPLSIKNNLKIFFIKIIILFPTVFAQRLNGFWWKISNDNFLDHKNFKNFLKFNDIQNIFIPNDYTNIKKNFLNKYREKNFIKIIEVEVGTRSLKTSPYKKDGFPLSTCDLYISSRKMDHKINVKELHKIKSLGCMRYSNEWQKKLNNIFKLNVPRDENKVKVGLFLNDRLIEDNESFLSKIKKIKNIRLEVVNKPKSVLPEIHSPTYLNKFNATQLINWADIIINHSSSVLIEAIQKNKNVFYCNFLNHNDKFDIENNFFEDIKGFYYFDSLTELINALENNQKYENLEYTNEDLKIIDNLKGFENETSLLDNYKKFLGEL